MSNSTVVITELDLINDEVIERYRGPWKIEDVYDTELN